LPLALQSPCKSAGKAAGSKIWLLEGVELKFIDLQLGCAYMYVCCKRGRTLSGANSLKKMKDIIHE
jgi:hypothetical protein